MGSGAGSGLRPYVAFLRGINVGGNNIIRMVDLRTLIEELGCHNVATYIQSGNIALESAADPDLLANRIAAAVQKQHGFEPAVHLLSLEDLRAAAQSNPFPEGESEPKTLHLGFLKSVPASPDFDALDDLRNQTERYELRGTVFYLHAPDGIARSKLAARAEKVFGVPMTSRNWRTVTKMLNLAQSP